MLLDISKGDIIINKIGDYEIIGSSSEYSIYVNCRATITLNNIYINVKHKSRSAFMLDQNADTVLIFLGENTLKSSDNYAGIQMNGKCILLIKGKYDAILNIESGKSSAGIGGGYSGSLNGDVTIIIKELNIYPESVLMNVGDQIQIKSKIITNEEIDANIKEYEKIEYLSQNENVAIVNQEGVVNAINEGKTNIEVIPLMDKSKVALCRVSVENSNTEIGKIDLIIEVAKDEININDLESIMCSGNNPKMERNIPKEK